MARMSPVTVKLDNGDTIECYSIGAVARSIERKDQTVRLWERRKDAHGTPKPFLPRTPLLKTDEGGARRRYYTREMIRAVEVAAIECGMLHERLEIKEAAEDLCGDSITDHQWALHPEDPFGLRVCSACESIAYRSTEIGRRLVSAEIGREFYRKVAAGWRAIDIEPEED